MNEETDSYQLSDQSELPCPVSGQVETPIHALDPLSHADQLIASQPW